MYNDYFDRSLIILASIIWKDQISKSASLYNLHVIISIIILTTLVILACNHIINSERHTILFIFRKRNLKEMTSLKVYRCKSTCCNWYNYFDHSDNSRDSQLHLFSVREILKSWKIVFLKFPRETEKFQGKFLGLPRRYRRGLLACVNSASNLGKISLQTNERDEVFRLLPRSR